MTDTVKHKQYFCQDHLTKDYKCCAKAFEVIPLSDIPHERNVDSIIEARWKQWGEDMDVKPGWDTVLCWLSDHTTAEAVLIIIAAMLLLATVFVVV